MFVYHERHKDAHGKLVLTELRLSSYGNGRLRIDFRNVTENTIFELCKQILKWPPVLMRTYDEASKVWSYLGDYGDQVLQKLHEITKPLSEIIEYEVEDLQAQCLQDTISFAPRKKQIRPEDFFYNTAPASAPPLTKEQLREKLAALMGTNSAHLNSIESDANALKKLYRHAALRLHPDRNQGNGAMMSELNMYWGLYNI